MNLMDVMMAIALIGVVGVVIYSAFDLMKIDKPTISKDN
jgi:multisubunit Na+/H+ antiporter MnhF subunit